MTSWSILLVAARWRNCALIKKPFLVATVLLLSIVITPAQSLKIQGDSPEKVVKEFCKLETGGARLTPEGWYAVAGMFVRPIPPPREVLIDIVKGDIYVGHPEAKGKKAVVGIEFMSLGQIDSAMRFTWPDNSPGPEKMRQFFTLDATENYWKIQKDGDAPREMASDGTWRIEEFQPRLLIALETAIRYVTESRDKSKSSVIKRNADRTLKILEGLR